LKCQGCGDRASKPSKRRTTITKCLKFVILHQYAEHFCALHMYPNRQFLPIDTRRFCATPVLKCLSVTNEPDASAFRLMQSFQPYQPEGASPWFSRVNLSCCGKALRPRCVPVGL